MTEGNFAPDPHSERRSLYLVSAGFVVLATAFYFGLGRSAFAAIFLGLAAVTAAGAIGYRWIGRGVFLIFALIAAGLHRIVSWVIVFLLYLLVVAGFGAVLRLFRMNRLDRDFRVCRQRDSMFHDAPKTDVENFRRQS